VFSFYLQQVVELEGYVIILVEGRDGKIKLYGSPADRDGLEVADEILDVNERKLDDVPRALVIKHIHEVSVVEWVKKGIMCRVQGMLEI
jgi:hypothetical protein